MDKQLLDALNNLSLSLEEIAEALENKGNNTETSSDIGKALKNGNFIEQIKSIDLGVKELQKDSKEILKNQKTILELSKRTPEKGSPTILGNTADPKHKAGIKDGLSIILMIAVGVLAIGAAFKLLGNVDFLSVIALSASLPLLAIAFKKISDIKLTHAQMKDTVLVAIAIATSIMLSSWIFSLVKTISIGQGLTSILIAGVFLTISYGIEKIAKSVGKVNVKDMWKLPIILVTMSTAIAASSWILSKIRPIGIYQGITAILIAATFTAISYGLEKIALSVGKANVKDMWKLPIILLAASTAIMLSSLVLQYTKPITPFQGLTAILIAATFTVIAFGISKILTSLKDVKDPKAALEMPIILTAVALAIALSSNLLQYVTPITMAQALTTILISASFVVISYGLSKLVSSMNGIKIQDVILLPLVLVGISAAIVGSSYILKNVQIIPLNTLINIVEQSLALSVIGIALGFSLKLLSKVGVEDAIEGGIVLLVIAGSIMASSLILSMGSYGTFPPIDWAIASGASLVGFGLSMFLIGMLGPESLELFVTGGLSILAIALTIAAVSGILSIGNYGKYPTNKWAIGVGESLLGFGLGAMAIGALITGTVGLGAVALIAGLASILGIAGTIVLVDNILSSGQYKKYPSLSWAQGVAKSMLAFGSVMSSMSIGGIFKSLIGDMLGEGSVGIAKSIVDIDALLSTGTFTSYPSSDWADGASTAISKFGAISGDEGILGALDNWLSKKLGVSVTDIAQSILNIDGIFSKGSFTKYPSGDWVNSISSLGSLSNTLQTLSGDMNLDQLNDNIDKMSMSYDKLAKSFKGIGTSIDGINVEKLTALKTLTGSIVLMSLMDSTQFESMMDALESKAKIFVDVINQLDGSGVSPNINIKASGGKIGKTNDDIYEVLSTMSGKLSAINASTSLASTTLSQYLNEWRSGAGKKLIGKQK